MKIVINNIKMPIKHNTDDVFKAAQEIVRLDCVKNLSVYKQSIDARRKSNIHYVYSVLGECEDARSFEGNANISVLKAEEDIVIPKKSLSKRPVVVGTGPCGLFAAYVLSVSGNPPIVLERGKAVEDREKSIELFWKTGILDKNSNIQFGEGGAGTFSDGKLTCGLNDKRQRYILKTFVKFGAPQEILYKAKPHIGTDILKKVVKNIRAELIRLGADIRFNSCLTGVEKKNGKLCSVTVNDSETIACDTLILAIGHSSRDTYKMLLDTGIKMEAKPFAVGVRIEHEQSFVDRLQYGEEKGLPPADYKVTYNGKDRSLYSFCMCPGGTVVNASSEEGMLCVNGMSESRRDGRNANSALVVTVRPEDFEKGVLGGIEFQRKYERLAFLAGGGQNRVPVQKTKDFILDTPTESLDLLPTATSGYEITEIKKYLPVFVTQTLKEGLYDFDRRLSGFVGNKSILEGIESRTSAPVRILRDENFESVNLKGLYPAGEGAGYAGGIVSAALDGIKCAFSVLG